MEKTFDFQSPLLYLTYSQSFVMIRFRVNQMMRERDLLPEAHLLLGLKIVHD